MAGIIKNVFLWDVTPCGYLRSELRLLVTANVVPSSSILFTLTMEVVRSSET
jgi:hypothetical protein